ncbi:hypothetical protein DEA8626_02307 [Defluviimonas aquaemixtae]|uniref:Core-binding (CB) domain-containing protein n=1 Tax=Albidovulum aquaemixtae TaxID=1542388 RepID=A0A2R8B8I7_9RHOB|nr:site-specific integrase [Defluviimonas aquaemixtae]SPH18763.1 hypothetical protein DEA8626_02307 [Defluviimonas aquaemixtae]
MHAQSPETRYPNVSGFRDRHGKLRWRYRKCGFNIALGTDYGSPEFLLKLEHAQRGERLTGIPDGMRRGTVGHALAAWLAKPKHLKMTKCTRDAKAKQVELLRAALGHRQLNALTIEDIREFVDSHAAQPSNANRCLGALRAALDDAVGDGTIKANPAKSVDRLPVIGRRCREWSEADIAAFYKTHVDNQLARLVLTLILYTGARRVDVVALGWKNVSGGRIRFAKNQGASQNLMHVDVPLHPVLRETLRDCPEDRQTFLQTQAGKLRNTIGLGNLMRRWCDAAQLPNCSAQGLRIACARRLKDAGMPEQEISAVLGYADTHSSHLIVGMGNRPDLADTAIGGLPTADPAGLLSAFGQPPRR